MAWVAPTVVSFARFWAGESSRRHYGQDNQSTASTSILQSDIVVPIRAAGSVVSDEGQLPKAYTSAEPSDRKRKRSREPCGGKVGPSRTMRC